MADEKKQLASPRVSEVYTLPRPTEGGITLAKKNCSAEVQKENKLKRKEKIQMLPFLFQTGMLSMTIKAVFRFVLYLSLFICSLLKDIGRQSDKSGTFCERPCCYRFYSSYSKYFIFMLFTGIAFFLFISYFSHFSLKCTVHAQILHLHFLCSSTLMTNS